MRKIKQMTVTMTSVNQKKHTNKSHTPLQKNKDRVM